ncbi:MAG: 3'(2'),5'-bisphosphate nucleotidase CysQ [Brumimicrobium sp.]
MNKFEELYKTPLKAIISASEAIMYVYNHEFEKIKKADGSPLTEADLKSSQIIRSFLEETNIPITGEEVKKADFSERKNWSKCWCVDPLDGTKEFIKKNGEFVVNIALIENQKSIFGIIASPVLEEIIMGGPEFGAFHFSYNDKNNPENWRKLPAINSLNNPITLISSRSHYSGDLLSLVEFIEKKYDKVTSKKMGSALKFFDLVLGKADIYPRFAPTMEWDIAAGQAIYEAVGGEVLQRGTGKPLTYNKKDLTNPFFVASKKIIPIHLTN